MRKTLIDPKKIIIPFLTLAFLINSWIPGITVNNLVEGSSHGRTAIVELYKSEVSAAQDYDSIPKSYNVRVFINDKEHEMTFAEGMGKPFIAKDRTFVPYRAMCEALGAKVDWIEAQKKVIANSNNEDNITVELLIGSEKYWVDKQEREMDVAPFIIREESRTYIPARYITEGLSYKIDFAKGGRVVYVVSFTRGQTEKEMQEVINEILEIYESKPQTEVGLPANIQWGSKTNKLTPEQRNKLEKIEIGPNAKLPLGSPRANIFNMAEDGYSHILETMQLNSNQAFFSSKDFMYVKAGGLITVRGELLTKNSDGSITVQMVDVWARKSPVVWHPTVMKDLETDEYLSDGWRR